MPSAAERIPRETGFRRSAQQDTYSAPPHGWTCFHCGVSFHATAAAREHFGPRPTSTSACKLVERTTLQELRRLEGLIASLTEDRP